MNLIEIARLCAATQCPLNLVGRLGFRIDEKSVRRAGVDYWHLVDIEQHVSFSHFVNAHPDARLRAAATPFPVALRAALVDTFLQQAEITVTHAAKISRRLDLQYLVGLCSGFVFFANLLVFAVNGVYPVLEKGGSLVIARLPQRPAHYEQRIALLFSCAAAGDYPAAVAMLERRMEREVRVYLQGEYRAAVAAVRSE